MAFIDYDEFLLPRYDARPLATLRRLKKMDQDVGGLYMPQTYWGGSRVRGTCHSLWGYSADC